MGGIKGCNKHNANKARKYVSRGKKFVIVFAVAYVAMWMIRMGLEYDLGRKLETNIDKAPLLAAMHNKVKKRPHLVLLYENGTVLFGEESGIDHWTLKRLIHDPRLQPIGLPKYRLLNETELADEQNWPNEKFPDDNKVTNNREERKKNREGPGDETDIGNEPRPRRPHEFGERRRPPFVGRQEFGNFYCFFVDKDVLALRIEVLRGYIKPLLMRNCIRRFTFVTAGVGIFLALAVYCSLKYKKAYESIVVGPSAASEMPEDIAYYNNSINCSCDYFKPQI
eukprot:TRINITY_DN9486_c0_g2_i3.p1 TRINITY_DN9486_c0_g2~~TRINITY_DN9486_c0_g2_i3.p1  ORF type:complete len:281 (+),score=41.28 TRINITY_DN9486_c0_g2_i3:402-1244(+)